MKSILKSHRIASCICAGLLTGAIGINSAAADDTPKPKAPPAAVLVPQLVDTIYPQTNIHFSSDETLAVSMHREHLHVWHLGTGTLLRVVEQPGITHYRDLRFENASHKIISVNFDFTIQEWDLETGRSTKVMPGRKYGGPGIMLAENTNRAFWLEFDGYLRTADLITSKTPEKALTAERIRAFGGKGPEGTTDALIQKPLPEATLYDMSISADGKTGLVQRGAQLQSVEVYNLDNAKLQCKIEPAKDQKGPRRYTLFPGGKHIFSTAFLQMPIIFSADRCKPAFELPFTTEHVRAVSITKDGQKALLSDSKNTKIIDINSKKIVFELPDTNSISEIAISPSGRIGLLSGPNRLELWDIHTGQMIRSLSADKAPVSPIKALAFSPTSGRIIASSFTIQHPILSIWDLPTLSPIGSLPVQAGLSARLYISADGSRAWAAGGVPRILSHWDFSAAMNARPEHFVPGSTHAQSAHITKIFERPINESEIAINTAGTLALTLDTHINKKGNPPNTLVRDLILWNGALPKTISTLNTTERFRPLALAPDGRLAAIARYDTKTQSEHIHIWNTSTGTQINTIKLDSLYIWSAAFAPDNKTLAATDITPGSFGESRIHLFDAETGQLVRTLKGGFTAVYALSFSPDQKTLAAGYGDRFTRLFDLNTGALISSKPLAGHTTYITSTAFSKDGRHLFTGSEDGVLRVHRLDQPASAVLITSGTDWLVYTDDGYFDASRRGGNLVAATSGLSPFRIDQFAVQKNRPDIILQRLGLGTPALIEHFRRRYERRLQKLGLREGDEGIQFQNAPRAAISGLTIEKKQATLGFELNAEGKDLFRYNIFVNDVPLFGAVGKPVSGKKASLKESFELSSGKNKIEVSTLDAAGNESLRDYRIVDHKDKTPGDLYYLGFGVSHYKNPAYNLNYPHKDILDLGDVLKAGEGAFQHVHIATYINEQVTVDAVRNAKNLLKNAKVDDTVILFVAGHGVREPGALGDYYFATHETDIKNLAGTAANFELIEDMLQGIAPRKKLLLMDTCESGEEDDELSSNTSESSSNTTGGRGLRPRTTRALVLEQAQTKSKSKSSYRLALFDRNRYVYNDLSRRSGAIVLSSSLGRELSWELDELQNGIFTEELLLALTGQAKAADLNNDQWLSIDELRDYISQSVPRRTGEKQHPTIDRDNIEINFGLPVVPSASAIAMRSDPTLREDRSLLASRSMGNAAGTRGQSGPSQQKTPMPRACGCRIPTDSSENAIGFTSVFIASLMYRIRRRRRGLRD